MEFLVFERYKHPVIWPLLVVEDTKYQRWLRVEIEVARAQEFLKMIPDGVADALTQVKFKGYEVRRIEKHTSHDFQAFLEVVHRKLKKLSLDWVVPYVHFGLTSYDVEDTAAATMLVETARILIDDLHTLASTVLTKAKEYKEALEVARTHGMHAEVYTFALKLLVWYEKIGFITREVERVRSIVGVGKISGAVGTYTLDPEVEARVCAELGLEPARISTQILDRNIHSVFVHTLVLIAQNLACFTEEIRNLQRPEIAEVQEFFARGQVGSSAMKHKRNPIRSENVSGMARLLRGFPQAFDGNIVTWHERDLTNSVVERLGIPLVANLTGFSIRRTTSIIGNMLVDPKRMEANLELSQGVIYSQNILLALRGKGMDPKGAERLVQRLAFKALDEGTSFIELLLKNRAVRNRLSEDEIRACFDPWENNLKNVGEIYDRFEI